MMDGEPWLCDSEWEKTGLESSCLEGVRVRRVGL
jgi:hypothetical protein